MAPLILGMMIFDNNGELIYLNNDNLGITGTNFRPQTFEGRDYLTLWSFDAPVSLETPGAGELGGNLPGRVYMLDHDYSVAFNLTAKNTSNLHEFRINPDGKAEITIYKTINGVDTTGVLVDGLTNSTIVDACFQEVDIRTQDSSFQFCCFDGGVTLAESFLPLSGAPNATNPWDYCHMNSVEKDALGNYLMSSRHTHTIYYIDGRSGKILWRLGGKNSTFTGDSTNFSWQHHARWVGEVKSTAADIKTANLRTRTLSLFDDEAASDSLEDSNQSRGLVIQLDFTKKVATIVQQYINPGGEILLATSQGSNQLLQDSSFVDSTNVLVGYGAVTAFAEYDKNGTALRVVHYGVPAAPFAASYRIFKSSWIGTPTTAPDLAIQDGIAYVSWNGATEVKKWSFVQGDSPKSLNNATTVKRVGFETSITLGSFKVVQAIALDVSGKVLAKSAMLDSSGNSLGGEVNGTRFTD
ncbi:ASST-domain-containing protein [Mycena floridula]|nr:ASST-domain-containing protein [Mycena floridula]